MLPKTSVELLEDEELELLYLEDECDLARESFYDFCRLKDKTFYTPDKTHLTELCNTLDLFIDGKLIKADGEPYKKIMINIPPQHGKTRTLINLCQFILGRNNEERIICGSYNDDTATDFSKYTRDGIDEEKNIDSYIVFNDIFPKTRLREGDSSKKKWALEGQHFNYLGSGIHGSFTGKGGTVLIIDDPIKNEEIAVNEDALEKIWSWYVGTFLSRVSAEGGEPLEICMGTRWASRDLFGRILFNEDGTESEENKDWYQIHMEAYNEKTDKMLCPSLLNKRRYDELRRKMLPEIFNANYHNKPIDLEGVLYKSFKTYTDLPHEEKDGKKIYLHEEIKNYTDTADEGDDYLCSINFAVYKNEAYITDVYYTDRGMEITEPETARFLMDGEVNKALIESNNGGRGFARNVKRHLHEDLDTTSVVVKWFHQSENKIARIITNSSFVMEHIYFPINWKDRWPLFYQSLVTYQKAGKNKHDDAEDCITGVAEITQRKKGVTFLKPKRS